jgi:hypothetical protein
MGILLIALLLMRSAVGLTIVTGPVKKSDGGNYAGRLLLKPLTLPGIFGGATVIGNDLTAKAAADGTLQNLDGTPLSLEPGTWEVDFTSVTGAKPVYLSVPDSNGTAPFTDMLVLEQPDGTLAAISGVPTTSIYVTDPRFGAKGDYTGTQNTAGTGTDDRVAIQSALTYAYTAGPGGFNDLTHSASFMTVAPKGKYYIGAPASGTNSLFVPPGVALDLREAEFHFDRPPLTYNTNTEPNPLFCGILVAPGGHVIGGKVIMKPEPGSDVRGNMVRDEHGRDPRAGIGQLLHHGAGKDNLIIGWRGAGIRYIGCLNSFVSNFKFWGNCFGIVQSYFGTAFDGSATGTGYQRYRGNTIPEGVCVALYVDHCSFLNIYKNALRIGVDGDYHNPAGNGFENITLAKIGGGASLEQCFIREHRGRVVFLEGLEPLNMTDCRIERSGWVGFGAGTIFAAECRAVALKNITWLQQGGTCFHATYTAPLSVIHSESWGFSAGERDRCISAAGKCLHQQ